MQKTESDIYYDDGKRQGYHSRGRTGGTILSFAPWCPETEGSTGTGRDENVWHLAMEGRNTVEMGP